MTLSLSEPIWLPTFDQVCAICQRLLATANEPYVLMDAGILHGALHRMQALWQYDQNVTVYAIGARLMSSIAQAHAFQQGNKRTSIVAGGVFCRANGFPLNFCNDMQVADFVEHAVQHHPEAEMGLAMLIEDYATNVIIRYRQA